MTCVIHPPTMSSISSDQFLDRTGVADRSVDHGSCSISHLVVRVYNVAAWPLANQFIEARNS